ncbi:MAG: hypothetical protein M1829_000670 [Trizodia sp. TS-e1964]|nr:MAG: hypothetical protein M1829_000670 [Trizodia sp. TS-e1964]
MLFTAARWALVLSAATIVEAHFVLQIPTSLGFDDSVEATGPCGSFNPTDRSTGVTNWPIAGAPIGILSTHTQVEWQIKAALVSDTTSWTDLVPHISQTGVGSFCFASVPGLAAWVGKPAVLQVIQIGGDGTLYQV